MVKDIIQLIRPELDKTIEFLRKELSKVRTGSASASLVEDIIIDVFGQKMPLKQLGGISIQDRRQIVIQPWDHSYLDPIEKALQRAELGTSPIVEKEVVRVTLPPLTEEYRETLVKMILEKAEQTRQTIRKLREQAWNQIQKGAQDGTLREDDKFKGKEELQKVIDEYQKKIDEVVEKKKTEIREI